MLAFAALVGFAGSFGVTRAASFQEITPHSVLAYINQERIQNGLAPLEMDMRLQIAAENKAADMVARRYFAHSDPDGRAPWVWIDSAGYEYTYAGENLAIGFVEPQTQHNAWMESTFHRRNILNTHYTQTGIAVVQGNIRGSEEIIVVQFFARGATVSPVQQSRDALPAVRGAEITQQLQHLAIPQSYAKTEWGAIPSAAEVVRGSIAVAHHWRAILRAQSDVWHALLMTLLVVQFSVSFAVASQMYMRIYKHVRNIDFHETML